MKRTFGLIGRSLKHSSSDEFFNGLFEAEDIDAEYLKFELPDISSLESLLLEYPHLEGFNVTIPYKEEIIPFLSSISNEAKEAGAVNVVKINRVDGEITLRGYNSDIYGFSEAFRPLIDKTEGEALILGTGGAAKAVATSLRKDFSRNSVYVSRGSKGNISYDQLSTESIANHKLIINATPLGMWPDTDTCPPIDYDSISIDHVCLDLVYNPLVTKFMRECAKRGASVRSGIDMLHLQAIRAWEIWNN